MASERTKSVSVKTKAPAPVEKGRKSKKADSQEDLDQSPSHKAKAEMDAEDDENPVVAAARAAKRAARKGPIEDDVTAFLSDIKSNDDAIRKTKKSEYFANINKKAWENLLGAKDSISGGLFRMRLGNMLRGSKSNAVKAAEKKAKAAEKASAKA